MYIPLGPRCDSCSSGHFLSSDVSTLCQACACNSQTSLDQNCNTTTGLCNCRTTDSNGNQLGLGGRTCEECIEGFFQFSTTGLITTYLYGVYYRIVAGPRIIAPATIRGYIILYTV